MNIGQRIKNARKSAGLTQKELAVKAGTAVGTIQQYELGKRTPRFEQLASIAEALGVSVLFFTKDSVFQSFEDAQADFQSFRKESSIDNAIISILEEMYGSRTEELVKGKAFTGNIKIYGDGDCSISISDDDLRTISCAVKGLISGLVSALGVDRDTALEDEIRILDQVADSGVM